MLETQESSVFLLASDTFKEGPKNKAIIRPPLRMISNRMSSRFGKVLPRNSFLTSGSSSYYSSNKEAFPTCKRISFDWYRLKACNALVLMLKTCFSLFDIILVNFDTNNGSTSYLILARKITFAFHWLKEEFKKGGGNPMSPISIFTFSRVSPIAGTMYSIHFSGPVPEKWGKP